MFCSCVTPAPAGKCPGRLRISLSEALTRTDGDVLDTGSYILEIRNSSSKILFRDRWENSPEEFELEPGVYDVSAVSQEFTGPAFGKAQYGDSRQIRLSEGESAEVDLVASLCNAGLRILFSEAFIAMYRDASVFVQSEGGTLAYGLDETRTAFFRPGNVYVIINSGSGSRVIYSASLLKGSITALRLGVAEKTVRAEPVCLSGLRLGVDTAVVRRVVDFAWDGEAGGGEIPPSGVPSDAVDVAVARTMAGSRGVWVYGYIAGGDLTSKSCSFEAPFSSRTNLLLAPSAACRDRSLCMSVQLSAGDIRNALNLVDNPSLLGRKIYLCGDVKDAYYGLTGLQNLTDYRL